MYISMMKLSEFSSAAAADEATNQAQGENISAFSSILFKKDSCTMQHVKVVFAQEFMVESF